MRRKGKELGTHSTIRVFVLMITAALNSNIRRKQARQRLLGSWRHVLSLARLTDERTSSVLPSENWAVGRRKRIETKKDRFPDAFFTGTSAPRSYGTISTQTKSCVMRSAWRLGTCGISTSRTIWSLPRSPPACVVRMTELCGSRRMVRTEHPFTVRQS